MESDKNDFSGDNTPSRNIITIYFNTNTLIFQFGNTAEFAFCDQAPRKEVPRTTWPPEKLFV
jgi:hypothetical protein